MRTARPAPAAAIHALRSAALLSHDLHDLTLRRGHCRRANRPGSAIARRLQLLGKLLAKLEAEIALDTSLPIPLGSGLDRRLNAVEALLSP